MLLIGLGFSVGVIGTLIGVGGGFILVPALLFLFPQADHLWITSVSMWVIAFNATSGSITYFIHGRVHVRAALLFALASFPGSVMGVWLGRFVGRSVFETVFGTAMILYACVLFLKKSPKHEAASLHGQSMLSRPIVIQGVVISFFVGFMASLLGIGGGVVHVPLMSHVLGFPVHLATGTSHMILAATAWFTTFVHWRDGDFQLSDPTIWKLGLPAILGAQLGAHWSRRVSGPIILKLLSVALFFVGVRLLWPR